MDKIDLLAQEFPMNLVSSQEDPPVMKKEDIKFVNHFSKEKDLEQYNTGIHQNEVTRIKAKYQKQMKDFIQNFLNEENEPLQILPKKANIDLKRYLKPKMDKLNKRTEKAIVKILKQKFQAEAEQEASQKKEEQNNNNIKNKIINQMEQENQQIQNFKPVYQVDGTKYDEEFYDEDEDNEQVGEQILNQMNQDYNIFQNFEEDFDSDE